MRRSCKQEQALLLDALNAAHSQLQKSQGEAATVAAITQKQARLQVWGQRVTAAALKEAEEGTSHVPLLRERMAYERQRSAWEEEVAGWNMEKARFESEAVARGMAEARREAELRLERADREWSSKLSAIEEKHRQETDLLRYELEATKAAAEEDPSALLNPLPIASPMLGSTLI